MNSLALFSHPLSEAGPLSMASILALLLLTLRPLFLDFYRDSIHVEVLHVKIVKGEFFPLEIPFPLAIS
ncbi:hypothetical protein M1N92_04280, partial [Dehalococcoidia bacterium]|nr:hypothetical protein [Dehalococcoidia bacterium]